jgi:hypothetical protein
MRKVKGSRRVVSDCCQMLMRAAALWVSESLCGRGLSKPSAASEMKAPSLSMPASKATTQSFHRFHLRVSTLYKQKVQHGVIRVCLSPLAYKSLPSQLLSINKTSTFSLKPTRLKSYHQQQLQSLIYHQQPTKRKHEHRLRTQGLSLHPSIHHAHH